MKRLFFLLVVMLPLVESYAQLGAPKITVRDTFQIVRIDYNKTTLAEQDWPCKYFVEDPICVDIAGYTYRKDGEPDISILGDSYEYSVVCNGKRTRMEKWVFRDGDYYACFSIDGYDFYVVKPGATMSSRNRYEENEYIPFSGNTANALFGSSGGNGFSLTGRSAKALPSPSGATQKQGRIIVKVWVDRAGNVVQVSAPEIGSTLSDAGLVSQAKQAAMKAKFNASESAAEVQTGTITYVFRTN